MKKNLFLLVIGGQLFLTIFDCKRLFWMFICFLATISSFAQDGTEDTNIVSYASIGRNYSDKIYNGLSLSCLNFSESPFYVYVGANKEVEVQTEIKVSLYVPTREFSDKYAKTFGLLGGESYYFSSSSEYISPALTDLEKIKEFPIVGFPEWNERWGSFGGSVNIPWDGMSDPALTGGKSYPVRDNVFVLVHDAQTGSLLSLRASYLSRYAGNFKIVYTAKQNSIVADIYFVRDLPVKKATAFVIDDGCKLSSYMNIADLREGGKMAAQSYSYGESLMGYQEFDNPQKDENGITHLSWEIKDLRGEFFDRGDNTKCVIGLIIDGEQEALNLGLKEGSETSHGSDDEAGQPSMPRPLNPGGTVDYPEFEIENGVLMHYHGNGGNVIIPNSITKIDDYAFYKSNITSVSIPNSVTNIGNFAFYGCSRLTSITIPNNVTHIGNSAFQQCTNLTTVTIPNSVRSIGKRAFSYCNNLKSVTIPNGITRIEEYTFEYCWNLSSVIIPNSVTKIESHAFHATWISSVTIPNSVTSIGESAFSNNNFTSVMIPNSVTSIGEGPFSYCNNLESIILEEGNQFYTMDDGVLFNKAKTILVQCPAKSGKEKYTIPNSVTKIGKEAFFGCQALIFVTIPNSVTRIGNGAFAYTGLTSVIIPNSVMKIEPLAFYLCLILKKVGVQWDTPLYIWNSQWPVFYETDLSTAQLIVPKGTKALYQVADIWRDFGSIVEGDYTKIKTVNSAFSVYLSNENLHVNSSAPEKIRIYSITGTLLYRTDKPAGEANFNIGHIQDKILIVKGDSGWVRKVIKY
jgi:hypothetical protein